MCDNTIDDLVKAYLRHPIRGPSMPAGILSPGTSLSFPEYQSVFYAAVEAIGRYALKHRDNDVNVFAPAKTRENSEKFEREWLKPLLRRERQQMLRYVNRKLSALNVVNGSRVRLIDVLPDEIFVEDGDTEAARRSPYDLWCTLLVTHPTGVKERLEAPVNVKYVARGTTHTNTGGAGMMAWALMGIRDRANRVHVFDTLSDMWEKRQPLVDSDYFFLSFTKGEDKRTTDDVWVSSLLGVDPNSDACAYAANQSFPRLQIHYRRAADCLDILPTANQARLRLLNWWGPAERDEVLKRQTKSLTAEQVMMNYVITPL
jgi:hypothetical protein